MLVVISSKFNKHHRVVLYVFSVRSPCECSVFAKYVKSRVLQINAIHSERLCFFVFIVMVALSLSPDLFCCGNFITMYLLCQFNRQRKSFVIKQRTKACNPEWDYRLLGCREAGCGCSAVIKLPLIIMPPASESSGRTIKQPGSGGIKRRSMLLQSIWRVSFHRA